MNATQAIHGLLSDALQSGDVHLLGEALELSPATRGLLAVAPQQVHLLPAADATLIGLAIGLAMSGQRAVIELAGPDALWGILQQLGQEAALLTGEFSAPLIIRVPVAPGEDIPLDAVAAFPDITLACPSSADQIAGALSSALSSRSTVVIIEPRELLLEGIAADTISPPRAAVVREGTHATVVTVGRGVQTAQAAAAALDQEGISVEVIDLCTLQPLDTELIAASVYKTGRPVLVGCPTSTLTATVRAAFLRLESPPTSVEADESAIIGAVRASVSY